MFFGQTFPGEKRGVRLLCCRDATASSFVKKVWGEVLAHFHAVAVKCDRVCGIDCLVCHDKFFASNPLMSKKIMIILLTLLFTCLAFLGLGEFGLSLYASNFLP
jgi:hypothetical protein